MTKPPFCRTGVPARAFAAILALASFAGPPASAADGPADVPTKAAAPATAPTELRLASPFSDHAVLQRGRPVTVWGEAPPGRPVVVALGADRPGLEPGSPDVAVADAGADGRWVATLPARKASATPLMLRAEFGAAHGAAAHDVVVRDLLVGDVWVCAGQSNMQMPLAETVGGPAEAALAAARPTVRLLTVPKRPSAKPESTWDAKAAAARWQVNAPDVASAFPAVGYYFAAELRLAAEAGQLDALRGVPIGLVDCSLGGTAAEAWASAEALEPIPAADRLVSLFGIAPTSLSNGMVAPLAPYPAAGVLWYQGEANAAKPELYPKVMAALIADWRRRWADPELPFLIVQLPAYAEPKFAAVREAQAKVVAVTPRTALAVALDTADGFDLHPKTKREIGRRLALAARKLAYGDAAVVAAGPTFKSLAVEGTAVRVTFDVGGDKLAVAAAGPGFGTPEFGGVKTLFALAGPVPVKGFALAGEDGVYHYADATITGDDVVTLKCDVVPEPKTVRYAWGAIPEASLTNRSGLPAGPFRTDAVPLGGPEVLPQPAPRRVATGAYELEVSGDGRVTSLGVGGVQFLSNAVGGAGGGTSIPGWFGPRALPDVRPLGPTLLACSDAEVTLTLAFDPVATRWTLENRGPADVTFRVALAAGVSVAGGGPRPGGTLTLARGKARLAVDGVDRVEPGPDGKLLTVTVKGRKSAALAFTVVGSR